MNRLTVTVCLVGFSVVSAAAADAQSAVNSLVVRHASVFDTGTRSVVPNQTVIVRGDRIAAVVSDADGQAARATTELDARGRLLVPGLIDAHHHIEYVFPDSITPGGGAVAKFAMRADSIARYRERWAQTFLPYGVTVVRGVGENDAHLELLRAWMRPSSSAPDFFTTGGALVSHGNGRVPFAGHRPVRDSADAVRQVQRYHAAGIRDIKLYWRLREPEYIAAFAEARRLGMAVTTHIDFGVMSIRRALGIGVRSFEHAYTLGVEVLPADVQRGVWSRTRATLGDSLPAAFYWGVLELFNEIGPANPGMRALITEFARSGASVTPTLHIFAQRVGIAAHRTAPLAAFDDDAAWTPEQRARARRGYEILAGYVRELHGAGVPLAVGSDWLDPGAAVLSEMLLLVDAGIPMADVLSMATLEGARIMRRERDYGRIAPGSKAHFVLFDRNPLADPRAVLGGKVVIKDGLVVRGG
jgi:imidazolonepropionase-like amidohydrolase